MTGQVAEIHATFSRLRKGTVPGMIRVFFLVLSALSPFLLSNSAKAQFGYLYTTDTLPKHKCELEQWITDREGQAHGYYHGVEMRTEEECGVTNNLQLSLYENYTYIGAHNNSVDHLTEGIDISPDHDPTKRQSGWHSDGVSSELLWRVLSPYRHRVGLALYVEPDVGPRENGVEVRTIVQKDFLDDRMILTSNVWGEIDNEQGTNLGAIASSAAPSFEKTKATYLEFDFGGTYRFHRNWSTGLEFRNHNEYAGWSFAAHNQQHTAFFLGPDLSYATQRWSVTFAVLRQLAAVGFTDDQRAQIYHGRLYGNEHTTWDGIRLRVARTF
jgi:hypothetical protein